MLRWRPAAAPFLSRPGNHDALLPGSPYLENGWPENVHIFRTAEPERVSLPEFDVYGAGFLRAEMPAMLDGFRAADPSRLNILVLHGDAENPASPYDPVSPPRWRPPGWIMPPLATSTAAASGATAARCARGPAA